MKTAMQEFFLVMKEFNKDLYNTMYNEGILDKSLEKERKQIKRAFEFGIPDAYNFIEDNAEEYYNQTYNN